MGDKNRLPAKHFIFDLVLKQTFLDDLICTSQSYRQLKREQYIMVVIETEQIKKLKILAHTLCFQHIFPSAYFLWK